MTKKEDKQKLIKSILHLMKSKKSEKGSPSPDPLDDPSLSKKPAQKPRPF